MARIEKREIEGLSQLLSRQRQEFYNDIRQLITQLLSKSEANVVVAAAMGASIKDILLTIPLTNEATIFVFDEGDFLSPNPRVTADLPKFKQVYRANCVRENNGTNFFRSGDFGMFNQHGYGKKDLIEWELADLSVEPSTISVVKIKDSNTYQICFTFAGKRVTIFFVEGLTSDYRAMPAKLKADLEKNGIDAVVARGDDDAYQNVPFANLVKQNLRPGAILVTDRWNTLQPHSLQPVQLSPKLEADLKKGIVFGYPTSGSDIYAAHDGVPLLICQNP